MDFLTRDWGEDHQEKLHQPKPKVEDPSNVCGFLLQKDSCLETIQERETTIKFYHQFYDPLVEYVASFFDLN